MAKTGQLRGDGFSVSKPCWRSAIRRTEILKVAEGEGCDLIAMAGHGHRLFGDIFHGSTITEVRHRTSIPILVVRAEEKISGARASPANAALQFRNRRLEVLAATIQI